jgi:acetyl esterase/lipase
MRFAVPRIRSVCIVFVAAITAIIPQLAAQQAATAPPPALQRPRTPRLQPTATGWVPLWPDGAPGAQGTDPADIPSVQIFLPMKNPARSAVIVLPGGGYDSLVMPEEGETPARFLADRGVAGIVLRYRIGPKYHYPIELEDAQRAFRYVRAHADQLGIDKNKIGVWGFSAGGHLAATIGTHFDAGNAAAADPLTMKAAARISWCLVMRPLK